MLCRGLPDSRPLAIRAKVRTPAANSEALNSGVAGVASLPPTMGYLEEEMGQTPLAVGLLVGIDASTTMSDGSDEYLANGPMQTFCFLCRKVFGSLQRTDSSGKEGFVSIHVANTSYDVLIEKQRFYRRGMSL